MPPPCRPEAARRCDFFAECSKSVRYVAIQSPRPRLRKRYNSAMINALQANCTSACANALLAVEQLLRHLGLHQVLEPGRALAHRLGGRGAAGGGHQRGVRPRAADQGLRRAAGRLDELLLLPCLSLSPARSLGCGRPARRRSERWLLPTNVCELNERQIRTLTSQRSHIGDKAIAQPKDVPSGMQP